eukprot:CCRYP_012392-RA/>CCRYP_012392-RA protein AED:0.30 eAED:0.09 QI:0/0/0/1/0.66/0.5/4/0/138
MALVALGSCFFTISSQLAFRDSPMTWDSSRVAAAIPSGVGFLGAGLIWKGSLSDDIHQVHGITTAASLWLAASVGVGAGGALYAVTAYSVSLRLKHTLCRDSLTHFLFCGNAFADCVNHYCTSIWPSPLLPERQRLRV